MTDKEAREQIIMSLDPRILLGIRQFNSREFFECHETLEALWMEQTGSEKQLTQGLIQIAVAYYHAERKNSVGAIKLLTRGVARVKPFAPNFNGIELQDFVKIVDADLAKLSSTPVDFDLLIPIISVEI